MKKRKNKNRVKIKKVKEADPKIKIWEWIVAIFLSPLLTLNMVGRFWLIWFIFRLSLKYKKLESVKSEKRYEISKDIVEDIGTVYLLSLLAFTAYSNVLRPLIDSLFK